MPELWLGNEAVAMAAIDAGLGGSFAYPGTPATEIMECVQMAVRDRNDVAAAWSSNEKVAYEAALGMSYAGRRALVSMKHVGLNVAADAFVSSSLTGVNGGLVLAVADDPGMHSSQNEQDSRYYAHFTRIPCLEPSDQQEAYDMVRMAFELSETFELPVMVRLVTRLSHSRGVVHAETALPAIARKPASDWHQWNLLPPNARRRYRRLLDVQPSLVSHATESSFNALSLRGHCGIIASGIAYGYVREALGEDDSWSILKIGAYPIPESLVRQFVDHCDTIYVFEEGYAFIENRLNGLLGLPGKTVHGKGDGTVPDQGELSVDVVRRALGLPTQRAAVDVEIEGLPPRPPQLCHGCPHCDAFGALVAAVGNGPRAFYFGDIGCYTLAAYEPYNAVDTCVDMGASIGMAIGAARAGVHPVIATIGDSTFTHSGMGPLLEAAHDNLNMTVNILDNAAVAMTGTQEGLVTGDTMVRLVEGLGVDPAHIVLINPVPSTFQKNVELMKREINYRGLSVVIARRPCIHVKRRSTVTEPATVPT